MDSKTIRYNNTRILVDQVGGVSNFANRINKGQSQTSQFAGTTPIKGIGNKVAREIEKAFGKPHGWLDIVHPELSESNDFVQSIIKDKYVHNETLDRIVKKLEKLYDQNQLTEQRLMIIESIITDWLSKDKN